MEDATAVTYWCHMCSRSVNPIIEGETINCNFCQSGFVEEIDETPDQITTNDNHPPHHQAAESLWAPILLGMMNDHDQNQRSSEPNVENEDDNDDDDGDGDDGENNDDGEFDLERHLEEIMRRRRRHSAAILDLLQGIRAGLSVESENNNNNEDNNNNNNNNQDSELVLLINSFNQRIRIQDDASSVPSGSLGDYFIGPGFEMLLQRLAENDPNSRYGTPPATKEAVESLETVRVVEEEGLVQCTVCLDDFEVGVEAREMPCKHRFHSECLLPWLELHSSCPVCRYLLPAGDDDGEGKTDAETSSNVSMENNGTSVDSSSNNPSVND